MYRNTCAPEYVSSGYYPAEFPVVDWLSNHHELREICKTEWDTWRSVASLKKVCEDTVHRGTPRYIAESAIAQHNRIYDTGYSYEDILGMVLHMDSTFMSAGCGEWMLFTDCPDDIVFSQYDDIEEAAYHAPDHVKWAILWNPNPARNARGEDVPPYIIIFRSPHQDYRYRPADQDRFPPVADGMFQGNALAFTLPPHEEANLR